MTLHPLADLIAPRSMAIVGTSECNHFARLAMRAADAINFDAPLHPKSIRCTPRTTVSGLDALAVWHS